jgi:hypothetical protein
MSENRPAARVLDSSALLARRKALLLARSSLYRLTLAREAELLRQSLAWRNLASSAASSTPVRPLLLGALMLFVGRSRIASLVGFATRALAVVKVVQAVRGFASRRKAP